VEDNELRNECEFENVLNFLANHKVIINCEICICQILFVFNNPGHMAATFSAVATQH